MAKLEDLKRGASVLGVLPTGPVKVIDIEWRGSNVIQLTYRDSSGRLDEELLYRDRENDLQIVAPGRACSWDGDRGLLRPVPQSYRMRLASHWPPHGRLHDDRWTPSASDYRSLRGDDSPPAAPIPSGPRSWRWQDDRGRDLLQGTYHQRTREVLSDPLSYYRGSEKEEVYHR